MDVIALRWSRHILVATAASLWLVIGGCSGDGRSPTAAKTAPLDSAGQVMFGVRAVLTDQGQSKGLLRADSGFVFDDGMRIELRRVTVTFPTASGATLSVMTAPAATYLLGDSRLELRGAIEITGSDGRKLQTSQLVFDVKRNRLAGDSTYSYTGANARAVKDVGLVADPGLARVLSAEAQRKVDAQEAKAAAEKAAKEKLAAERAAKRSGAKPSGAKPSGAKSPP